MNAPVLVTGAAGFIGFHVAKRLLDDGHAVVGVDSLTSYYSPALKEARLKELKDRDGFVFMRADLADARAADEVFGRAKPSHVVHLAAQPGVRAALTAPRPYIDSNIVAFLNVLEGCRHGGIAHLVYASSSSVYGANRTLPFSESDRVDHPVSLYAATKKANEMMAHSYSHLFDLAATGLRFFTVYGPWGRPDMAVYTFTEAIAAGRTIEVSNGGRVWRDFTYIDDIVEGVVRTLQAPPSPGASESGAAHRVFNIGNDCPETLDYLIGLIETALEQKANRISVPLPPGDVLETRANIDALKALTGFAPVTPLETGITRFVEWWRGYHMIKPREDTAA